MNNSKFQLILTGVFAGFILIGVITFAFFKGGSEPQANIIVWGTISQNRFSQIFSASPLYNDKAVKVAYVEKNIADFDRDFVESLASGIGPDLILVPHETVFKHRNRIFVIPFNSISERTFRDSYAEVSEIFVWPQGILSLPVAIDPLVMYWNRDIFSNEGISQTPRQWSEFYNLSSLLTRKDGALNISKSVASLGEFRNVNNSKELISTLIIQAGNPITAINPNGSVVSVLSQTFDKPAPPAQSALTFYTEFSNPTKAFYSWNRSLPNSQDFFLSGDLAIYFGFASEAPVLRLKNPNLNFDMAPIPQTQSGERNLTFGRVYGFSIVKNSRNIPQAFMVGATLASAQVAQGFSDALSMAPVRRDLLTKKPTDRFGVITYDGAIWAKSWIDTSYGETADVFMEMIESITGGRSFIQESVIKANTELSRILSR